MRSVVRHGGEEGRGGGRGTAMRRENGAVYLSLVTGALDAGHGHGQGERAAHQRDDIFYDRSRIMKHRSRVYETADCIRRKSNIEITVY